LSSQHAAIVREHVIASKTVTARKETLNAVPPIKSVAISDDDLVAKAGNASSKNPVLEKVQAQGTNKKQSRAPTTGDTDKKKRAEAVSNVDKIVTGNRSTVEKNNMNVAPKKPAAIEHRGNTSPASARRPLETLTNQKPTSMMAESSKPVAREVSKPLAIPKFTQPNIRM
jgi:hypothetical protein